MVTAGNDMFFSNRGVRDKRPLRFLAARCSVVRPGGYLDGGQLWQTRLTDPPPIRRGKSHREHFKKKKKKGKRSGNIKWAADTLTFSVRILRSGSNLVLFHASVISILNVQALMDACHYVSAACLLFSHSIYSRLLESAPACTTSPKAL